MTDKNTALVPEEGWHCLHLFYHIEYGQWQLLSREEQNAAKTNLSSLVQEVRAMESTQLLTLSMVSPKADLGFMLITPDLHNANRIEKRLSLSLGADVLTPVYGYLSLTEESEYITNEDEYVQTLEPSVSNDPAKLAEAMNQAGAVQPRQRIDRVQRLAHLALDLLHRPRPLFLGGQEQREDRLIGTALLIGHRGGTLVLHGKGLLSVPRPRLCLQRGGTYL